MGSGNFAGPAVQWRPGRTDKEDGKHCPPDGRLPDAAQGAKHVRDIFYRMGFDDREIVVLSGAHALGRCAPMPSLMGITRLPCSKG